MAKRGNRLQAKAYEFFLLAPAPNYPPDPVSVLHRRCTVVITRKVTRQCVSPAPPTPPETNGFLPTEEVGSAADDGRTSD